MEQRSNDAAGSAQLERALDILELLARTGRPEGLTDIAGEVGGPKATVHRLLATLQSRGYVTRDPYTSRYGAGVRCFELGSLWAQNLDLRAVAAPFLARLNEDTAETVHLAVYDHGDVVYVDKLESPQPVVAKSQVGRRCPSTCVATGRALLAFQPAAEIRAVLSAPLPAYTEHTTTDPDELAELLVEVRRAGYATNRESYRIGVGGIAAPIREYTGAVVASVGLCLPVQRFGPERIDELRDQTVRAAAEISAALGDSVSLLADRGREVSTGTER